MKKPYTRVNGLQRPAPLWRAPVRRVVVVRALPGLGDFLCAVPALRALRHALPKARVDLVGLPATRPLVQRFSHYIDGLIEFPGFPGLQEGPARVELLPDFLSKMHDQKFDLALQMHGDGSVSNIFTLLLGAKRTAGFYLEPRACLDPQTFFPYPQNLHEIQRNLALLRFLNLEASDESYEFRLTAGDQSKFERLCQRYRLKTGQYVCVHAGAQDDERRWSPDKFARAGSMLRKKGFEIVLTGTAEEAETNAAVRRRLGEPIVDLTGQTSLGALALLLRQARLLLCNDTGVSHLAAAMETPSVVIFLTSEPLRWAPLNRTRHIAVGSGTGSEIPTVEEVCTAIHSLLNQTETAVLPANQARTAPLKGVNRLSRPISGLSQ